MNDETRRPPHEWPDEEGGAQAQDGLRSDVGASQSRPRQEDSRDPVRIEEPTGQRGPAGAGDVPGRGKLGTATEGEEAVEDHEIR